MSSIKCGNCKATHTSVVAVKQCYATKKAQAPVLLAHAPAAMIAAVDALAGIDILDALIDGADEADVPVALKTGQDLDLGMYQTADAVYKVKFNKAGTQKYAEKLLITMGKDGAPKGKFLYAYGMMAKLTSADKMDEAAAKAFHDATKKKYGQDYGFCCVCGKLLTVKKSIDAGIGPVCSSKL